MKAKVTINANDDNKEVYEDAQVLTQSYDVFYGTHTGVMVGGDLVAEIHDLRIEFNEKYMFGFGYRAKYVDGKPVWDYAAIRIEPIG